MSVITITNADEAPVFKYGQQFEVGESKEIPTEVLQIYALMEQSLALQYISRHLGRIERQLKKKELPQYKGTQMVEIMNFPRPEPWIVTKWNEYKQRRAFKARIRRQSHASS